MLQSLTVRDFLLLDRLDLAFLSGLTVLTGETGAGKSILLDALGLATGGRAETGLVRPGSAQAVITASFDLAGDSEVFTRLAEQGLEAEPPLILRRTITAEGRSRAFVNDQPVSVGLLRSLGAMLVEIQGQFEQHGLLDEARHASLLDEFAETAPRRSTVAVLWQAWQAAAARLAGAAGRIERDRAEQADLRAAVDDLDRAAPEPGEEEILLSRRRRLTHNAQIAEALAAARSSLDGAQGAEPALNAARRALERVREKAAGAVDEALAALERASIEAAEARALLDQPPDEQFGPEEIDRLDTRLGVLRAVARRHGVDIAALPELRRALGARLAALEDEGADLKRLAADIVSARAAYLAEAAALTRQRATAAARLDREIVAELGPLKLVKARFETDLRPLDEAGWGPDGVRAAALHGGDEPRCAPGPARPGGVWR